MLNISHWFCSFILQVKLNFEVLKIHILQEGEQYAKENGMFFIETSAKTAQNVNELFYEIGNL